MARILFTTFGSFGDLHPYLAVGMELRRLGHAVTIATSASYRGKVEAENLRFHPVRPDTEGFEDPQFVAELFDARRGSERVVKLICSAIRESYEDTLPAARQADVMVTHIITFAAVAIAQKLNMPWVSSVLAPFSMLSAIDPPVFPQVPWSSQLRALGPGFMRLLYALGDRRSRSWTKPLLELRRELGLTNDSNPLLGGSRSPALDLALFSAELAKPQSDWPQQTVLTGFPFFDRDVDTESKQPAIAADLERFLDEGSAPVVFTLGSSAVYAAKDFYRASLEAVERLGVRAVFLTSAHPQGLPNRLPQTVIAVPYAPHSAVFPRAAAIVHQGGIGTTAQAMRAGKPMLVVPFSHDQFDNGDRVRRNGAGEVLTRKRYNAGRAEGLLTRIISAPSYASAAARMGETLAKENGASVAAAAIDRLVTRQK